MRKCDYEPFFAKNDNFVSRNDRVIYIPLCMQYATMNVKISSIGIKSSENP